MLLVATFATLLIARPHWSCAQPTADCATACLRFLAAASGVDLPPSIAAQMAARYHTTPASMLDLKKEAGGLGLALQGVKCELAELQDVRGPVILHLAEPDHFVVLLNQSSAQPQVLDCSGLQADPLRVEPLLRRFSGRALVLAGSPPERTPWLEIPEPVRDVQSVDSHDQLLSQFAIHNRGSAPLHVEGLEGSCGVSAACDAETLEPGASATVLVRLGRLPPGRFETAVALRTDDPSRRTAYLSLYGSVPAELAASPDHVTLTTSGTSPMSRQVRLVAPSGQVLRASTDLADHIAVDLTKTRDDGVAAHWSLTVRSLAGAAPGQRQGRVHVSQGGAGEGSCDVEVVLSSALSLDVLPARAFFGFVKRGERDEQTLTIRSRSATLFTIKNATLDAPGVSVGEPVQVAPSEWKLNVTLTANRPGVIDTKLVVTTDVPGEETLQVPVYAHVLAEE